MIEVICFHDLLPTRLTVYDSSVCSPCRAILRVSGWQHWVLVLGDLDETNLTDQSSLAQMTTSFLLHMLSHCLRAEQDGWKPWVETTATIHAFVSVLASMHTCSIVSELLYGIHMSTCRVYCRNRKLYIEKNRFPIIRNALSPDLLKIGDV